MIIVQSPKKCQSPLHRRCKRGIGLDIVRTLSQDTKNTVISAARSPSGELHSFAETHQNVHVITLDLSSQQLIHSIGLQLLEYAPCGVDIFILNGGIGDAETVDPILETPRETYLSHYITNTLGPIFVARALYPFLKKSDTKTVIFMTSTVASMGRESTLPTSAYGQSKAALNNSIRFLTSEL